MSEQSYMNIAGHYYMVDRDNNTWPRFTIELRQRSRAKLAINVLVSGEAGIGKSMLAIQLAQSLDPRFDVDQIVYSFSDYLEALVSLGKTRPIVFDEPSYSLGKRTWYLEIQQALVKTMESQRFMQHPVFIPIINPTLLDKTIRSYLIQYLVFCYARGKAIVYRFKPSQFEDKTYSRQIAKLDYELLDGDKCDKDSCLDCGMLPKCEILRAKYERKKKEIQLIRYKSDQIKASERESKNLTLEEVMEEAHLLRTSFTEGGKIDVRKMRVVLRTLKNITVSANKSYDIKEYLEKKYEDIYNV